MLFDPGGFQSLSTIASATNIRKQNWSDFWKRAAVEASRKTR